MILKIVLLLSLFLLEPKDNLLFLLLFDAHFKMVEFLILIYYATKLKTLKVNYKGEKIIKRKKLATKIFFLPAKDLLRLILVHGLLSEFCQLILEPGTAIHELLSVQVENHWD